MEILYRLWDTPGALAALVLFVIFVVALSSFLNLTKIGPNPFINDSVKPPRPLVTDPKARDEVLKQGFHVKKVPENLDVIVIGSGVSGLTVAATLSKVGKRVLVLEQHDQAGGACHTFVEKGFEFDVGVHYVGEMESQTLGKTLFDQLTEGQLQWTHFPDSYDTAVFREGTSFKKFPFRGGLDNFKKLLLENFPQEKQSIENFLQISKDLKKFGTLLVVSKLVPKFLANLIHKLGLPHLFVRHLKYGSMTTQQALEEITTNKQLQGLLAYSFGDYGTPPTESCFALHNSVMNHFMEGASYPRGGASEIAMNIIPTIEKAGGRVLVRAPVSKILFDEQGRACGVQVQKTSGDIDLYAGTIVSAAALINTVSMLPKEIAERSYVPKLLGERKLVSGPSCIQVYVGLRGTTEELNLPAGNVWAFPKYDLNAAIADYFHLPAEKALEMELPRFISFPSAKDPTYDERYPGKSACTIIALANWDWFDEWKNGRVKKRGEEYESLKNEFGNRLWEQTLDIFPQLRGKDEYLEVGSPLSAKYYLDAPKGEIYSLDHDYRRFTDPELLVNLRPRTDIPGLLLTGQDILTGGVMGASLAGVLTASVYLNRNLFGDLESLEKRRQKGAVNKIH